MRNQTLRTPTYLLFLQCFLRSSVVLSWTIHRPWEVFACPTYKNDTGANISFGNVLFQANHYYWSRVGTLFFFRISLSLKLDSALVVFHVLLHWNASSDWLISLWAAANPFFVWTSSTSVVDLRERPRCGRNLASKAFEYLFVKIDPTNIRAFRIIYIQWVSAFISSHKSNSFVGMLFRRSDGIFLLVHRAS